MRECGLVHKQMTLKADGIRLLRKLGFPQMHSPVEGKLLYRVDIKESGFYLFEHYTRLLNEWKQARRQYLDQ